MHKLLTVILLLTTVSCAAVRPSEPLANQTREAPRYRISSYATDTFGTRFTSATESGNHSYEGSRDQNNGIIYACRGGHIDLAHLRKAADWTAFLAERAYLQLLEGQTSFTSNFMNPLSTMCRSATPLTGIRCQPTKNSGSPTRLLFTRASISPTCV